MRSDFPRHRPGFCNPAWRFRFVRRGFTLVEILVTVVILGIAGALVIPAMGQAGVLRVQATLRTIVSDISFAQADAMASQSQRVMVFGRVLERRASAVQGWGVVAGNGYVVVDLPMGTVSLLADADIEANLAWDPDDLARPWFRDFSEQHFSGALLQNVRFVGAANNFLVFDDLGGPVNSVGSVDPMTRQGSLEVFNALHSSQIQRYSLTVQAYTGRVVVAKL